MNVTILEALENAELNVKTGLRYAAGSGRFALMIAEGQIHNAHALLEKGYSPHTEVDPLLDAHGDVENVPEAPCDSTP